MNGPRFRAALGAVIGLLARCYLATLRVRIAIDPALNLRDPRPFVLCFWHGDQLALLRWNRRRPTVALVSHSPDGQMQARALARQGLLIERGSTSRGGARGLLGLIRKLLRGHDAAFAVDGPRGPRHCVAPGAIAAARLSRGLLVPMGSAAPRGVTLERTWDRFRIPLPFSRVAVYLGPPIEARAEVDPLTGAGELAAAIVRASSLARIAAGMIALPDDALLRHARRA